MIISPFATEGPLEWKRDAALKKKAQQEKKAKQTFAKLKSKRKKKK